jgi:hypothetical protein
MPANKIVIHEKGGNVLKGTTADFFPKRSLFHLSVNGTTGGEMKKIFIDDLKAVFFVKAFSGNKDHKEAKGPEDLPGSGKKIRVVFKDGETISGYTHAINMEQPGFFLIPIDQKSNNERIFIVFSSLSTLEVDGSLVKLTH